MSETRKVWTRGQVKKQLEVIAPALKELEAIASGGQMPSTLRKKVQTTSAKVRSLVTELNNWAITSQEKALAYLRQEEGPRVTSKGGPVDTGGGRGATGERGSKTKAALPSPEGQRPKHNRYERLSKELREQIITKGQS